MANRVVHFEIHAQDPERVVAFYQELFGWRITKWDGPVDYWLITTGDESEPGINGAVVKRQGSQPQGGEPVIAFVCTVDVADIDQMMEKAKRAGAETAVDKMSVPGVGWLCYLKDTDGNIFGMMQNDPQAT